MVVEEGAPGVYCPSRLPFLRRQHRSRGLLYVTLRGVGDGRLRVENGRPERPRVCFPWGPSSTDPGPLDEPGARSGPT